MMELLNPSTIKKEKFIWLVQGVLLLFVLILSIFWLVLLGHEKESIPLKNLPMPQLDYEKIGKGLLAISPKTIRPELQPLLQELVLIGKNTRPHTEVNTTICLGLKTSGSQRELISGQKVFLTQDSTYQFSEKPTDLALIPLALKGSEVLMQIEFLSGKEEFIITPSPLFRKSLDEETYVQCLKKGKMWGPDLFLNQWGGEEYRDLSSKHKVEMDGKIYFLAVGDVLWWDGHEWNTGDVSLENAPLARVHSAIPQGLIVEIWDGVGYASSLFHIPLQHTSKIPVKVDQMITSVRSRSPTEITCQLGKRRVIVKEGDWWVKTDRRWRPLKTANTLEAFLRHEIQGELVMFEKIESSKGKITLKGRCFDPMRTESQPLSLVVNTDKKALAASLKHETSRASMLAKSKMVTPPLHHQNSDGEEEQ